MAETHPPSSSKDLVSRAPDPADEEVDSGWDDPPSALLEKEGAMSPVQSTPPTDEVDSDWEVGGERTASSWEPQPSNSEEVSDSSGVPTQPMREANPTEPATASQRERVSSEAASRTEGSTQVKTSTACEDTGAESAGPSPRELETGAKSADTGSKEEADTGSKEEADTGSKEEADTGSKEEREDASTSGAAGIALSAPARSEGSGPSAPQTHARSAPAEVGAGGGAASRKTGTAARYAVALGAALAIAALVAAWLRSAETGPVKEPVPTNLEPNPILAAKVSPLLADSAAAPTTERPADPREADSSGTAKKTSKEPAGEGDENPSPESDDADVDLSLAATRALSGRAPKSGTVRVQAVPKEAIIYDAKGKALGKGAADVPVLRGGKTTVVVLLDRHSPEKIVLDGSRDTVDVSLEPTGKRAPGADANARSLSDAKDSSSGVPPRDSKSRKAAR